MLPQNILVPTDLSDGAGSAVELACELANRLGATVHLLNVIGIPSLGMPELGVALTTSVVDSIVADNQRALTTLAEAKRRVTTIGQVLLKTGDPRDVINQVALDLQADLIVMGTHGRRGVTRALLGSVAESVVRSAPCPVLTVRAPKDKHEGKHAA